MRTLYEVFIVDIHSEESPVLHHAYYVAESEKEATVEAAVAAKLGKARGHHFIVKEVGSVPDPKRA